MLTLNVYQLASETSIEDFSRNALVTILLTLHYQLIFHQLGESLPLPQPDGHTLMSLDYYHNLQLRKLV